MRILTPLARPLQAAALLPALAALLGPALLRAQFDANLGRVVGGVADPNGGAIAGAQVVATHVGTGAERRGDSDVEGRFRIGSLRPGTYLVTASSPDFAPSTAQGVVVGVGRAVRVDLVLDVETTYTRVEVSAALLDAILPANSNVVASRTFSDLPINGRRFHDFALLTPTVQVSPAAGHLSFGAQRGVYTNVMVDGTNYNQAFFGGIQGGERAGSAMTVPQSAIQEFQAVTSGFTAEYGQTISGVINVSTKSGANSLHGDAFYQLRHPRLGLPDPFGAKVLERLAQYGGSAGGPARRDTAFWFFAFEQQRSDSPRYVEFPLLEQADRSSGPEAYDYFRSLEHPFTATNDAVALTPRMDYQFREGSQLMVRYNYSRSEAVNEVSIGDATFARTTQALSANGTEQDSIHYATGQLTSVLSPEVVNQLRFTVTRERRPRLANGAAPHVGTRLGSFGTQTYLPTVETDIRPVLSDSLMIHAGAHDLKVGGMFDRVHIDDMFGANQFGTFYLFDSDPDRILDILTPGGQIANRFDAPGIFLRQIGNTLGEQRLGHAAAYFQDSWRVAEGFTLDLGFRWEGQFNQAPRLGNDLLVERVRSPSYPAGQVDPAYIPDSVRQWMPRVGFAYNPAWRSGRLVLRGSAGVFYATTPPVWLNDPTKAFREPSFDTSVAVPSGSGTVYSRFLEAGIDLNRHPLADLPVFSMEEVTRVLHGDPYAGASPAVIHPEFRNPRSVKYTLGGEVRLAERSVAGLQWTRQDSSALHGVRDFNLPPAAVRPGDAARIDYFDRARRPAPLLGSVMVTESIGRADYQGVTASWKYTGGSVQLVAHYTYARAFSSDANDSNFWGPEYHDNQRPGDEYGPSILDMRHQFTGHAVIRLPGGFTGSAIARGNSAHPMSPLAGADINGDNYSQDRALQAPGVAFGRNSFRNRGFANLDLRLLRRFGLGDEATLELSAELFNALNLDNVAFGGFNSIYGPGVDPDSGAAVGSAPSFRRLRTADGAYDRSNVQLGGGPLQVQVGARLRF